MVCLQTFECPFNGYDNGLMISVCLFQDLPFDMSVCVFVLEQALSVRALQEMVSARSNETVSSLNSVIYIIYMAKEKAYSVDVPLSEER